MIPIKPKQAALQDKTATQLFARTMPTELHSKNSGLYCELQTAEGEVLFSTNLEIPEELYSQWGEDDMIIEEYVFEKLNLEKP